MHGRDATGVGLLGAVDTQDRRLQEHVRRVEDLRHVLGAGAALERSPRLLSLLEQLGAALEQKKSSLLERATTALGRVLRVLLAGRLVGGGLGRE